MEAGGERSDGTDREVPRLEDHLFLEDSGSSDDGSSDDDTVMEDKEDPEVRRKPRRDTKWS